MATDPQNCWIKGKSDLLTLRVAVREKFQPFGH
jgi:hypothetical protein